ncbi:uncharacterized protein LOC131155584 isoform X2 [Malania oleifera]|uniref:uncharacterized protein LOC131155584 isoform X2 n=1 Tax=Malania oleifera TaxID=397392 RepID=UPI0025AEA96D|nr:uncharacterized protein LOC131155584 isoform X2 [Malania oleifera]
MRNLRGGRGNIALFLILWFVVVVVVDILICPQGLLVAGDGGLQGQDDGDDGQKPPPPSLLDMILYDASLPFAGTPFLDKLKSLVKLVQKRYFPPNLESRDEDRLEGGAEDGNGAGAKIKMAVEKSFGSGKETVEGYAKTAGEAVGEAVHKTAEKVKGSFSDKEGSNAEL